MADPHLEDLEAELKRQGEHPCLWTAIQKVHGMTLEEAQTPDAAYSMICTLNNGISKGFWKIVLNPAPEQPETEYMKCKTGFRIACVLEDGHYGRCEPPGAARYR